MSRPSPIEAAKARHPLAEVARRTGINVPGGQGGSVSVRCPMPSHGHPDRTPSMRLHLDDGVWCCFACSPVKADGNPRGADVIDWVRQTEGVTDWRDAIRILDAGGMLTHAWAGAESAGRHRSGDRTVMGRPGEPVSQAEWPDLARTSPDRAQDALDAAWDYYTFRPLHERGVAYLAGRGIDVVILEAHNHRAEVGHTPRPANGLVDRLRTVGFCDDELVDAGLAHRRLGGGPLSDFYRQRVLIPIRDAGGNLAGLIGRNIGDPDRWAKYKNPPRTHRYDKSVNLYKPLPAPCVDGQVVVVEGTLDAMAIAVAAIRAGLPTRYCPVTQSGRELSDHQLGAVLAMHPGPPVLGMDGDGPGRDSNARLALAAARRGRAVIVTTLPEGEDPASWLAKRGPVGLNAWTSATGLDSKRSGAHRALAHEARLGSRWLTAEAKVPPQGIDMDRYGANAAAFGHG
jgi:DNA primase